METVKEHTLDAVLDIPIVLPPLVIGLSLLILFNKVQFFGASIEVWCQRAFAWLGWIRGDLHPGVTYKVPAVILAQFTVACAFAVRTLRTTFEQISPRCEQVALTLGCTRSQAFWSVVLPEAGRGILTSGTLAWARALGEFGATIMFAGNTIGRTQTMPLAIFAALTEDLTAALVLSALLSSPLCSGVRKS